MVKLPEIKAKGVSLTRQVAVWEAIQMDMETRGAACGAKLLQSHRHRAHRAHTTNTE